MKLRKVHAVPKVLVEQSLSDTKWNKYVALISMSGVNEVPLLIDPKEQNFCWLFLVFDDVNSKVEGCQEFTKEMAIFTAEWIYKAVEAGVYQIICQCTAGMSRSAGMAGAIAKHFLNDDTEFFYYKTPNMLVYSRMLEALHNHKP